MLEVLLQHGDAADLADLHIIQVSQPPPYRLCRKATLREARWSSVFRLQSASPAVCPAQFTIPQWVSHGSWIMGPMADGRADERLAEKSQERKAAACASK